MVNVKKYGVEELLWNWAAWCYKFEEGLEGWPAESVVYKLARGEQTGSDQPQRSKEPFKRNDEADRVHNAYLRLKEEYPEQAEAFYASYVFHLSGRMYELFTRKSARTFYHRVSVAKKFMTDALS